MKKQLIWVFEWRKSVHYWWNYISFSPECKELTSMLDPLLYMWGVPPVVIRCVHRTMQMWVLQTWIKAQGIAIVMYWHIFHSSSFHHICNINCRLHCRYSPQNIFNAKNFNPHKKPISLLNVPICTQGMQPTWWPQDGTIIVTGPNWETSREES